MIYVIIGIVILCFLFSNPIILIAIIGGASIWGIVKLTKTIKRARKGITKEQENMEKEQKKYENEIEKMQEDGKYEQYMEGQEELRKHYNILKETLKKLQELQNRDYNDEDIELIYKYVFVHLPKGLYGNTLETQVNIVKYAIEHLTMPDGFSENHLGKMFISDKYKQTISKHERKYPNEYKNDKYYIYYMGNKYSKPSLSIPVKVIKTSNCPVIKKVITIRRSESNTSERLVVDSCGEYLTIFCNKSEYESKETIIVSSRGQIFENLEYDDQNVIIYNEDLNAFREECKNESKKFNSVTDYREVNYLTL